VPDLRQTFMGRTPFSSPCINTRVLLYSSGNNPHNSPLSVSSSSMDFFFFFVRLFIDIANFFPLEFFPPCCLGRKTSGFKSHPSARGLSPVFFFPRGRLCLQGVLTYSQLLWVEFRFSALLPNPRVHSWRSLFSFCRSRVDS